MRRLAMWLGALVVLAGGLWMTVTTSALGPYVLAAGWLLVLAGALTNVVIARRRQVRVTDLLHRDAHGLSALQDDLLGRLPSPAPSYGSPVGPVATLVDDRGDPLDELVLPAGPSVPAHPRGGTGDGPAGRSERTGQ